MSYWLWGIFSSRKTLFCEFEKNVIERKKLITRFSMFHPFCFCCDINDWFVLAIDISFILVFIVGWCVWSLLLLTDFFMCVSFEREIIKGEKESLKERKFILHFYVLSLFSVISIKILSFFIFVHEIFFSFSFFFYLFRVSSTIFFISSKEMMFNKEHNLMIIFKGFFFFS